jgi:hypothetical protein
VPLTPAEAFRTATESPTRTGNVPAATSAAPLEGLSEPARLGAATVVALPAPGAMPGEVSLAASVADQIAVGPTPSPATAVLSAPLPSGTDAVPLPQSAAPALPAERPAGSVSGGTREATRPVFEPQAPPPRRVLERSSATSHGPLDVPPFSSAPPSFGPVEGLSGLVAWWDARAAAPMPEHAGPPPRAIVRATAANTPHEAARTAEGAFEGSPQVRLSLRAALEELLLAEARTSGIEVRP